MKKFFAFLLIFGTTLTSNAQAKGAKIGYIDMDYILENVPDYKEANIQLEQKAQKWKQDIQVKKNEINKLENILKSERALLTKELIEEREEEIKFLEKDLIDYQQKRFGSNGDFIIQKTAIAKPVQDQVFTAVQDIAEARGYDFIFDKSSDLTMLFSKKSFDISDRVVRMITQSEKREQISKKQLKANEEKEEQKDKIEDNPALAERQKILEEKKALREKIIKERKESAAQNKKEYEEKHKKILENKTGAIIDSAATSKPNANINKIEKRKLAQDSIKKAKEAVRLKTIENNKKTIEDRNKALEEKKKKIAADKEAAKTKK
ncbi:OmpH family outer membrane protein [Flavobacterium psychrophilum]|jgi:Skp family chaperone for outer membrane proteins|uniref:Outer membrane chaperone Skp (OmpH) n=2 Tax=Flavobacterium psychrophilum TaxID=96345 RepID=A6H1D5_FLAPJ|nr:OmpH family outer membrane protein [Flavobacterium psychrophilum]EKT3966956.1 OmpH family outer membrane protein [Flavobacterium psychrophilum]EKT4519408.1 OmpH family outer membrane protein [Flavobacterium psychrophilum]EKT4548619.1 OmpH family outer membrane protein [Flavobacterium psychrophilum]MBF2023525.1 OmpH family outer membrane protein [Flavobacterium psychrophilum]MBF2091603.1 OmpH family outer membrane protein [Flavobacterium psychrophilum]